METSNIQTNTNKEVFSPMLLAFLKQKIKELGQEKNEQIIMESLKVVADEISNKQTINAKAIKEELEEKLKSELATKDFVRAEIAEAKQELKTEIAELKIQGIYWLLGVGVVTAITIISSTWVMMNFMLESLK